MNAFTVILTNLIKIFVYKGKFSLKNNLNQRGFESVQ